MRYHHHQQQTKDDGPSRVGGDRSNICIDIEAERLDSGHLAQHEDESKDEEVCGRGVVVIAATNRLEDLDPAVVRRFEAKVYVGVPEHDTRVAMIINFLR